MIIPYKLSNRSISRSGYKDGSWSKTKGGLKNISINRSKSGRKVCG